MRTPRIGVYVDGFNVYYGGSYLCEDESWKWLDIKSLVKNHLPKIAPWSNAEISHVVYFTAPIKNNPEAQKRQQTYIEALKAYGSVDHIEFGNFSITLGESYAATGTYSKRPKRITLDENPLPSADWIFHGPGKLIRVRHEKKEEKGSDVNLASHLLIDLFTQEIDLAVVVSNDSDLSFPIRYTRKKIPVGIINTRGGQLAGGLRGLPEEGAGGHFWATATAEGFYSHQLPEKIGHIERPQKWKTA